MCEYIEIKGFNGGTLYYLPEEKHLFVRKTFKNGIAYLVCYDSLLIKPQNKYGSDVRACTARCQLNKNTEQCCRTTSEHSDHRSHEIIFRDLVSLNAMKEQCRYLAEKFPFSAHLVPISEIFLVEMAKRVPGESKLTLEGVERQLYRIRDKHYPKKPKTDEEVKSMLHEADIYEEYGSTLNKQHPFYVDSVIEKDFAFHLFISFTVIGLIRKYIKPNCRNYLVDGTFKIAPRQFKQLLILSIEYKQQIFPVCYVLMSSKTALCYEAIFKFIEAKVFKLEPGEFITDFELGMRSAINKCYPGVPLRGCWYHFCAALRKKLLKLGLHNLLKSNSLARVIKIELMSLPLLPAIYFKQGYEHIKRSARNWKLFASFEQMFAYFENYWFAQNERNPLSVTDANMRTTSSLESMNSTLRRICPDHPHIFKFLDRIRLHEFSKSLDMLQAVDSDAPMKRLERRRRTECNQRMNKISYLTKKLKEDDDLTPGSFLEAMANKCIISDTVSELGKRKAPDVEYEPYAERSKLDQQGSVIPKKKSRNEIYGNSTIQIDKIGKRKAPDDEYEPYEERTRLNQQESMIPKKKSRNETNDNFTSPIDGNFEVKKRKKSLNEANKLHVKKIWLRKG